MEQEIQDGLLSHATHRDHNEAVNLPKSLFLKISKTRSGRVVRKKRTRELGRKKERSIKKICLASHVHAESCEIRKGTGTPPLRTTKTRNHPPWNLLKDPAMMS
jgi:hypothetical protein